MSAAETRDTARRADQHQARTIGNGQSSADKHVWGAWGARELKQVHASLPAVPGAGMHAYMARADGRFHLPCVPPLPSAGLVCHR